MAEAKEDELGVAPPHFLEIPTHCLFSEG